MGDHPAAGRQLPQPEVDGRPLDDLLGSGYAVLVRSAAVAADVAERLEPYGRVVEIPEGVLDHLLVADGAIVVRPDRYVAAVADDATTLAHHLTAVLPARP